DEGGGAFEAGLFGAEFLQAAFENLFGGHFDEFAAEHFHVFAAAERVGVVGVGKFFVFQPIGISAKSSGGRFHGGVERGADAGVLEISGGFGTVLFEEGGGAVGGFDGGFDEGFRENW